MNNSQLDPHTNQNPLENQSQSQSNPLQCTQSQPAHNVCLNSNCSKTPFLCSNKSCPCFKTHKGCIKSSIQSISEALHQKIISIQPFQTRLNQLINNAIDNLSLFADQIIINARQSLNHIGLTQNQRKFIKIVQNQQNLPISSKQMHQIYESIDDLEQFTKDILRVEDKINQTWNSLETQMKKSFLNIKKQLNLLTIGGVSHIFGGSKIIKKHEERINLSNFFDKKVKETTLLYRASENEFDVEKFYENCKNVGNTMVVCKTEYNKVIGGFTPIEWKKFPVGEDKFYEDNTRQSFVFSLTNNSKFKLLPNCYAIKCFGGGGPTFGNTTGFDLSVCDKGDVVRESVSKINSAYKNDRYESGNPISWESFSGSRDAKYLLKEWEVWYLEFES